MYERLKAKTEGMTRLVYTRLRGDLEYLKTRLKDERFESVMEAFQGQILIFYDLFFGLFLCGYIT